MHKDLIVAIFAENGNSRAFGTGYPVAEDLILTSRHVVRPGEQDAAAITVKWFYDKPPAGKPEWSTADLVWPGTDDLDAALLRCRRPESLRRFAVGRLVERRPVDREPWQSAGFARANKRDDVREPGQFGGTLRTMAEAAAFFEVIEDAKPIAEEQWKGVSGMPVFAGSDLLGVVKHVPPNYDHKKLEAVPVWRLLQDDDFKKWLGLDEQHERLDAARNLLIRLLEDSEAVTRDLAMDLKMSCGELVECRQQVVERLLTETLERLFELTLSVQMKQRSKKDRGGVRIARELTLTILPAIHDAAVVSDVRRRKGDANECIIALPTELSTLAEIIMAGADRRAARLRPPRREGYFPEGEFSLPEPPEPGRDPDNKQVVRDWRSHLLNAFASQLDLFDSEFRLYLQERFRPTDKRSSLTRTAEARLYKVIARELRYQAEEKHNTYYFIADMSDKSDTKQRQEAVLATLKRDFPAIAFLRLACGEDDPEGERLEAECSRYRKLCDLLYEAPESNP